MCCELYINFKKVGCDLSFYVTPTHGRQDYLHKLKYSVAEVLSLFCQDRNHLI